MTAVAALDGCRVVLTQQRPGRLAERLQELGAVVTHVPLTEIAEPADGGAALVEALDQLERFEWLVVTSVNGARHVGTAAARATSVRLAAVGRATGEALAEIARRPVALIPRVERVDGLLAEFPTGSGRVLVAQGNLAGGALASGLRTLGYTVAAVEAYSTRLRPPDDAQREVLGTADVVVLASGSGVEAWRGVETDPIRAAVVAIGPKTASAATRLGVDAATVAESPDDDDIVAAVRTVVARRSSS